MNTEEKLKELETRVAEVEKAHKELAREQRTWLRESLIIELKGYLGYWDVLEPEAILGIQGLTYYGHDLLSMNNAGNCNVKKMDSAGSQRIARSAGKQEDSFDWWTKRIMDPAGFEPAASACSGAANRNTPTVRRQRSSGLIYGPMGIFSAGNAFLLFYLSAQVWRIREIEEGLPSKSASADQL